MLHYQFPEIKTIDDVLPHIRGRDEFIVAERPHFVFVNYLVVTPSTFAWNENDTLGSAIRRECRGLIFNKDGTILARRYHKFFNLGEREETKKIEYDVKHHVLEKLDGSMVSPAFINGEIKFLTKMGLSDVAQNATDFVHQNFELYNKFMNNLIEYSKFTYIFEWCSPLNRIVVQYPRSELVLTAVRSIQDGYYIPFNKLDGIASKFGVRSVDQFLLEEIDTTPNIEGVVVRYHNGHMLKIKTAEYVRKHSAKDSIILEKNMVSLIINNTLDDVLSFLSDDDANKILLYQEEMMNNIHQKIEKLEKIYWKLKNKKIDKKQFALKYKRFMKGYYPDLIFRLYNNTDSLFEDIIKLIGNHIYTQPRLNTVKYLYSSKETGAPLWVYNFESDN